MKKLLTTLSVFGLILFFSVDTLSAQRSGRGGGDSSGTPEMAIKIGPLGFLFGSYNATFEKKLSDKSSFVIGGRFSNYELLDIDYTAIGLNAQYRLYFQEAIAGPYLAPSAGFDFNNTSIDNVDGYSSINIGANIGWQWVFGGGFVLDLGIGARYRTGFGDSVNNDFNGVRPAFQMQIGYAF